MSDLSDAASQLGRQGGKSKSERKLKSVCENLAKARSATDPVKRDKSLKKAQVAAKKALTPEERKARAKKAAETRWKNKKEQDK